MNRRAFEAELYTSGPTNRRADLRAYEAVNLSGTSRTKVARVYDYLRTACAFAEEAEGRQAFFDDQEVEVDSARTVATRTSRTQTEHRGRVLGLTERVSGGRAYVQLPNTVAQRGAPTAPETRNEVEHELAARIGPSAILCADGSQAWGAAVAATGLPVATAAHNKKEYVRPVALSVKRRPGAAPDVLAAMTAAVRKRPSSTDRQLRVQGGDNLQEANFGGVKNQLRRRNALRGSRHAGAQFLASAWLLHSPGLEGVGKAVRMFLSEVVDRQDPRTYWQNRRQSAKDSAAPVAPQKMRKRPAASR